ncbi:hypothetical protein EDC01DRAFT_633880 [Geopyxis carbonaria]|nr:hypothetical protein EDC01DRAFT_633880 [Geopyxis carbonaria]
MKTAAFISLIGLVAASASPPPLNDQIVTTGIPGANVQYGSISTQLTFATTGLPPVSSVLNPPHSADTRTTGIYAQPTGINSVGSTYIPYLPDESTAGSGSSSSSSSSSSSGSSASPSSTGGGGGGAAGGGGAKSSLPPASKADTTTTTGTATTTSTHQSTSTATETSTTSSSETTSTSSKTTTATEATSSVAVVTETSTLTKRQVPAGVYYDPLDLAHATGVVASGTGGTALLEYFHYPLSTGIHIAPLAGTGVYASGSLNPSGLPLYNANGTAQVTRRQVTPPPTGPVAPQATATAHASLLPGSQGLPPANPTPGTPYPAGSGGSGNPPTGPGGSGAPPAGPGGAGNPAAGPGGPGGAGGSGPGTPGTPVGQPVLIPGPNGPIPAILGPDGRPTPVRAPGAATTLQTVPAAGPTPPVGVGPMNMTNPPVPALPPSLNGAEGLQRKGGLAAFALVVCGAVAMVI